MNDTTFYQGLSKCFNQGQNCKECPLFAQGHRENDECKQMLMDEIRDRKVQALQSMDKESCEEMLLQTLKIAVGILRGYNPEADYLNMAFIKGEDGTWIHVDNANDANFPIEASVTFEDQEVTV